MDWTADKGGGGAIDLVMHVQGIEFKEAALWLFRQTFPLPSANSRQQLQNQEIESPSLEIPLPSEKRWIGVRDYLTEIRQLPTALVDRLHERGLIYADMMQNAVFVRHSTHSDGINWYRGEPTGATLRGTWGGRKYISWFSSWL